MLFAFFVTMLGVVHSRHYTNVLSNGWVGGGGGVRDVGGNR